MDTIAKQWAKIFYARPEEKPAALVQQIRWPEADPKLIQLTLHFEGTARVRLRTK